LLIIYSLRTENRRASVDIFLKAGGYLDCAVRHVLPQLPAELRLVLIYIYIHVCVCVCVYDLINHLNFFPQITLLTVVSDFRRNLPVDLAEGVLRALCLQALGQVFSLCLVVLYLSFNRNTPRRWLRNGNIIFKGYKKQRERSTITLLLVREFNIFIEELRVIRIETLDTLS